MGGEILSGSGRRRKEDTSLKKDGHPKRNRGEGETFFSSSQ